MLQSALKAVDPARTALAFRGYNITNLGQTPQLLRVAKYLPTLQRELDYASQRATEILDRPVNLMASTQQGIDLAADDYGEAVAFILAVEFAHFEYLKHDLGFEVEKCRVAFGYSLGEIAALVCGGLLPRESAYEIPLKLANDCVKLMSSSKLGIVFSKRNTVPALAIEQICQDLTKEHGQTIAVSSHLSPNTLLVIGQGRMIELLAERIKQLGLEGVTLRSKDHRFPPLHTPIMWQLGLTDRAALLLQKVDFAKQPPSPPIFSMVTGKPDYTPYNARAYLRLWMDHPQRLWDAIDFTFTHGVDAVIHLGPDPNLIPATYRRISENVASQYESNMGIRALSYAIHRPWLQSLLPQQAFLLRAPTIKQIILEDELLKNATA